MISMTINGVAVTIQQNTENLNDATEDFDVGSVLIVNTDDNTPYADFSDVIITMGSYTIKTVIQKDTVSRVAYNLYQHEIVFTEYAIKLAMYQHPDRKFDTVDGAKTTYLYHLETILDSIVGYVGKTNPLSIATATQTILDVNSATNKDNYADEKEYTQGNLLLTLIDMFRYVNAIPTLNEDNEIGHKLLGDIGDEITFTRIDGEIIESDIADYGYRVYSKVKNASYEADLIAGGTYFPGENDSVTVRSLSNKYQDTDAVFILDSNIRRMVQALATNISGYSNLVINIVSKDEWEELETCRVLNSATVDGTAVYEDVYRNNTPYYDGNVIAGVGVEYDYNGLTVDYPVIREAIRRAIFLIDGVASVPGYSSIDIRDIEMNFYYQPQRDMDIAQVRYDYSRVNKNATVLNTQKDSTLELNRYGTANKSYINRIGNDKYQIVVRYYDRDNPTPFEVFDYTSEGYKIIKRQFIWRGSCFDVKYELTKNQSILNPITGVKYESVSPFTITQKSVLTNYLYEEYYEFSDTNKTDTDSDSALNKEILLNALSYSSVVDTPIWNATYRRGTSDYISMPVMNVPMGNSFEFNVQFNHPKFAGYELYTDTSGWLDRYQIEPLLYTDEYGQATSVRVQYSHEPANVVADTYPLSTGFGTPIISVPIFSADLQPNEKFALTYAKHCITDVDGFIIGDYFLENNSIIKTLGASQTIAIGVYNSNPNYTIYDKWLKGTPDSSTTLTYNVGDNYFDIGTAISWVMYNNNAASTGYKRVYFAFNKVSTAGLSRVYLNAFKDDPNIETL